MSFTIDTVYQNGVPRGHYYESAPVEWDNSTQTTVTITPATSPADHTLFISEIRFIDATFNVTVNSGELVTINYPDYKGENTITLTYNTVAELKQGTDREIVLTGDNAFVKEMKPPSKGVVGLTVTDITIVFGSDVTVNSGSLFWFVKGWTIRSTDF